MAKTAAVAASAVAPHRRRAHEGVVEVDHGAARLGGDAHAARLDLGLEQLVGGRLHGGDERIDLAAGDQLEDAVLDLAGGDVDEVQVVEVVVAAAAERTDDQHGDAELRADAAHAAEVVDALVGGAIVDAELGLELLFAGDLVVAATG